MSKCWYCNNELTTGDNPKHFGICNKCYDEMSKSSDTIIRSLTNKIADLEAKLAESEWKNFELLTKLTLKEYAPAFCTLADRDCEALGQIERLKQQLAEKERQVKKLNNEAQKYFEDAYCNDFQKQTKIDFAVEQLEKVKEKILSYENVYYQFLESGAKVPVVCLENFRVKQTIDNQINELKGEKV